jgi:prefoldin subunit 5
MSDGFSAQQWTEIAQMIGRRLAEKEEELSKTLEDTKRELNEAIETINTLRQQLGE